jgi:hypothetical protein
MTVSTLCGAYMTTDTARKEVNYMNKDTTQKQKVYVKPDVEEVVYEMDSNIAAGCNLSSNTQIDYNTCTYEEGGFVVFSGKCDNHADDYGFCYHVPNPSIAVFSS